MRIILLIAVVTLAGCGSPQEPTPGNGPNENAVRFFKGTSVLKADDDWPVMFRSGHLVMSVYPPVASKVKLEVENTKGEWSPMDRDASLAQETMVVVPYRVANISHAKSFAIDDEVAIVCKMIDWRDHNRMIGAVDDHRPDVDTASPVRVLAPVAGYLGGVVMNRPFKLAPGASVAGVAAFRLVDIEILLDGDGPDNLAFFARVTSSMTDDTAAAIVDIPATFVIPKKSAQN